MPMVITEQCRLLIFEDEHSMQAILSEALLPNKFHLKFVSKDMIGNENSFNPELILLDHTSAPLLNDTNLCRKIKAIFPNIPLIVISAYPLNNMEDYRHYIDLFIAKPFDLNHFLHCMENYWIEK